MFERYTDSARRALFFARYECSELGAPGIDTEHLLLGLMRASTGLTRQILARAGIDADDIRQDILRRSTASARIPTSVELPFSEAAKRALLAAAEEANRLKHGHITTEHLLLGLLVADDSIASATLRQHGLTVESVRADVAALPPVPESPTSMDIGAELDRIGEQVSELGTFAAGTDPERALAASLMVTSIQAQIETLKRFLTGR
jgi:ATP-dependent Clp protease ATP-binding subunit ClpA